MYQVKREIRNNMKIFFKNHAVYITETDTGEEQPTAYI